MHPRCYSGQALAPVQNTPCSDNRRPSFFLVPTCTVSLGYCYRLLKKIPPEPEGRSKTYWRAYFGSRPPVSRYLLLGSFSRAMRTDSACASLLATNDSHFNVNTMLDAGAMPPLVRAAQNVSLDSTGELNLGRSSTANSASLPGSRFTCVPCTCIRHSKSRWR